MQMVGIFLEPADLQSCRIACRAWRATFGAFVTKLEFEPHMWQFPSTNQEHLVRNMTEQHPSIRTASLQCTQERSWHAACVRSAAQALYSCRKLQILEIVMLQPHTTVCLTGNTQRRVLCSSMSDESMAPEIVPITCQDWKTLEDGLHSLPNLQHLRLTDMPALLDIFIPGLSALSASSALDV